MPIVSQQTHTDHPAWTDEDRLVPAETEDQELEPSEEDRAWWAQQAAEAAYLDAHEAGIKLV